MLKETALDLFCARFFEHGKHTFIVYVKNPVRNIKLSQNVKKHALMADFIRIFSETDETAKHRLLFEIFQKQ